MGFQGTPRPEGYDGLAASPRARQQIRQLPPTPLDAPRIRHRRQISGYGSVTVSGLRLSGVRDDPQVALMRIHERTNRPPRYNLGHGAVHDAALAGLATDRASPA